MKKYIIIILCGLMLTTLSCEDIIEADAPNNQIGSEQVFSDAQTAYSALSGIYSSLRRQSLVSGNNYGMGALLGAYADDLDCYYNDQNGYQDLYHNQQQATNSVIQTTWNTTYQQIYAANAILLGVQDAAGLSLADSRQIRGEALLIRSMLYFYLQGIFDGIPYTTTLDYEYNRSLSPLSKEQLLVNLAADLTQASDLLEDNYRDPERIYPNRSVAQLLLAQVYLLQEDYTGAEQAASVVLQSGLYDFQGDLTEVFHKGGTHILWQVKPQYNGDSTLEAPFYYFSGSIPQSYALTQDLVMSFEPGDLRRTAWIELVENEGQQWFRPKKYVNLSGANFSEYSIVYRLEEVYLLLAEALAMQDKLTEAAPYLNATRLRAGLAEIQPATREAFLEQVLLEKRHEFFTEQGIRFRDLKRMGKLTLLSTVKPGWDTYNSVWPYPQNELLLNPNLNPQHDGY
jgi:hypothetical protein